MQFESVKQKITRSGRDTHAPYDRSESKKFRLHEHPWLATAAVSVLSIGTLLLVTILSAVAGFTTSTVGQVLSGFVGHLVFILVLAPFLLGLPSGRQSLREYLDEIRLTRINSLGRLLALALSCYLILATVQVAAVFTFRLIQGDPITLGFIGTLFDVTRYLPPESTGVLLSLPAALEEATFRGVLLFTLLYHFSTRKALVVSSVAFGLTHLLNVLFMDPVFVLGQVGWATLQGLFFGYLVLKTDSLLPAMIVHYLSNAFVLSITAYVQQTASIEVQALFGLVLTIGLLPSVLMVLWVQYYSSRWLPSRRGIDDLKPASA